MPKLSIITPVKNAASWLAECIESGLKQDFGDWEWLWVDDHSEDDSAAIIRQFAAQDRRITLQPNPGQGILPALQKALQLASGEYITRMDADDLMPAGRLQKMVSMLAEAPEKTVLTGKVCYFSDKELSEGYRNYQRWLNETLLNQRHWQNIYRECVVASPNWMMRRAELIAIKGFDQLSYPEDYDLVFRWYQHGFELKMLDELTLLWREHSRRTSRLSENYAQESFFNLKIQRFLELDYSHKTLCVWGKGPKARLTTEVLKRNKVPYVHLDLKAEPAKDILHYKATARFKNPQVLVAVYPPPSQMAKLEKYLQSLNLQPGKQYWFL